MREQTLPQRKAAELTRLIVDLERRGEVQDADRVRMIRTRVLGNRGG